MKRNLFSKTTILIGAPVIAAVIWSAMYFGGEFVPTACWAASITFVCAAWWIFEPIPIPATSLIPFAMFPLTGVLSHKDVASSYGHHLVLLLMAGFIISKALEKSNTHRRLALLMVHAVGGKGGRRMVLGFMLASAVLSMWISNTATALMLMPVALAVLDQVDEQERGKLGVPLMLAIAYAASIGGMATPIGTPTNLVFVGVYGEKTGNKIAFANWMGLALPIVAVMIPITWLWLTRGLKTTELKLPPLGAWTKEQKRVMIVFAITALAWIFRAAPGGGWTGWLSELTTVDGVTIDTARMGKDAMLAFAQLGSMEGMAAWVSDVQFVEAKYVLLDATKVGDSTVGLLAVLAMFLIPTGKNKGERLLDWETAVKIPWGLLILVGGGMAIAKGFSSSGLDAIIGDALSGVTALPMLLLLLVLCLCVTFLTEVTSNTATASLLMPILAAMAIGANMDPKLFMVPAVISCSCAFMLPVATMPNAIVFGTGHVTVKQMAKEGFVLNVIGAVVISLIALVMLGG